MRRFDGRAVVVTGGNSGMGRAIAEVFVMTVDGAFLAASGRHATLTARYGRC